MRGALCPPDIYPRHCVGGRNVRVPCEIGQPVAADDAPEVRMEEEIPRRGGRMLFVHPRRDCRRSPQVRGSVGGAGGGGRQVRDIIK